MVDSTDICLSASHVPSDRKAVQKETNTINKLSASILPRGSRPFELTGALYAHAYAECAASVREVGAMARPGYVLSNSMDELQLSRDPNLPSTGVAHTLALSRTASSQLTFGGNQSAAADATYRRPILYDHTDDMALPQRRLRRRPLRNAVRHYTGLLASGVRTQLLRADECLYRERSTEAIRYLEVGLLGCRRYVYSASKITLTLKLLTLFYIGCPSFRV